MSKTYPCPNGIEDDCGYPACAHAMQCERAAQERLARTPCSSHILIEFESRDSLLEMLCHRQFGGFPVYICEHEPMNAPRKITLCGRFTEWFCGRVMYLSWGKYWKGVYLHFFPRYCIRIFLWGVDWHLKPDFVFKANDKDLARRALDSE